MSSVAAYPGRLSRGLVLVKWWLLEPGGPEPGGV